MVSTALHSLIKRGNTYAVLARVVLTFMFWRAGLAMILDFKGTLSEMQHFKFAPALLIAIAVVTILLVGSILVISGQHVGFGAFMLGAFTLATIPVAHDFWNMAGEQASVSKLFVIEHLSVVGGLMVVAAAAWHRSAFVI